MDERRHSAEYHSADLCFIKNPDGTWDLDKNRCGRTALSLSTKEKKRIIDALPAGLKIYAA